MLVLSYIVLFIVLVLVCKKLITTHQQKDIEDELDKLDESYLKGRR